jgi:hypothetical protein
MLSFSCQLALGASAQYVLQNYQCGRWRQILFRPPGSRPVGSVARSLDPTCRVSPWQLLCDVRTMMIPGLQDISKTIAGH